MKKCSVKNCNVFHDAKYKLCDVCREESKTRRRIQTNSKVGRIIDLCEKHKEISICNDIMRIINEQRK